MSAIISAVVFARDSYFPLSLSVYDRDFSLSLDNGTEREESVNIESDGSAPV
jgi:hypothetical protein